MGSASCCCKCGVIFINDVFKTLLEVHDLRLCLGFLHLNLLAHFILNLLGARAGLVDQLLQVIDLLSFILNLTLHVSFDLLHKFGEFVSLYVCIVEFLCELADFSVEKFLLLLILKLVAAKGLAQFSKLLLKMFVELSLFILDLLADFFKLLLELGDTLLVKVDLVLKSSLIFTEGVDRDIILVTLFGELLDYLLGLTYRVGLDFHLFFELV